MSMISAQVDELRELATRYDELQVGAVKAVTMPSDMGSILRDAADTIWQLRDDLQRANAENAKLRERSAKTLEVGTRWMAKAARFESENAKLRELCADLYAEMLTYSTAPNYNASVWAVKLRELGVEP